MMHKFSYEHNRSKIRAMHPKILGKIYLEPNYVNLVNKIIYKLWHIAVVLGIILGNF